MHVYLGEFQCTRALSLTSPAPTGNHIHEPSVLSNTGCMVKGRGPLVGGKIRLRQSVIRN